MGNNNSRCDLEWYQDFASDMSDFKNIVPYFFMYTYFQFAAFFSVFFPNMEPWAYFVRDEWLAYRAAYKSQGNLMYSW